MLQWLIYLILENSPADIKVIAQVSAILAWVLLLTHCCKMNILWFDPNVATKTADSSTWSRKKNKHIATQFW